MNKELKYPSRDLTFDWGRTAYERLSEESDKIDNKGLAILSIGSLIIGIVASLKGIALDWTIVPFLLAFLSYIFLVWQAITAFRVRKVIVAENPRKLKEKYWELSEDETKGKYWESIEQSCDYNLYIIGQKGKALYLAIPALGIEVMLLIIWLLLRSLF